MQDFLGFLEPGSCTDLQIRLATSMLVAVLTRLEKENGAANSNQKAGITFQPPISPSMLLPMTPCSIIDVHQAILASDPFTILHLDH